MKRRKRWSEKNCSILSKSLVTLCLVRRKVEPCLGSNLLWPEVELQELLPANQDHCKMEVIIGDCWCWWSSWSRWCWWCLSGVECTRRGRGGGWGAAYKWGSRVWEPAGSSILRRGLTSLLTVSLIIFEVSGDQRSTMLRWPSTQLIRWPTVKKVN